MTATPFRLGLTGSIGMGKTTTAAMFADAGVPVWDADRAVHRLYSAGGAAVLPLESAFPGCVVEGVVNRSALTARIAADPGALARIEAIVHPLVAEDRQRFLDAATHWIVVLDIPLLFETGAEKWLDATLLVTAPAELQKQRVMARPGMTEAMLATILGRQMPDREKRARADHIIETLSLTSTRACVEALLSYLEGTRHA
ncbi:MAG: dephospho-CoA kinase [Gemmobacter sp.]